MAGGDVWVLSVARGPRPMDGHRVQQRHGVIRFLRSLCCFRGRRLHLLAALATLSAVTSPAQAIDLAEAMQLYRGGKYAECLEAATQAIADNDFSENFRLLKLQAEMELG